MFQKTMNSKLIRIVISILIGLLAIYAAHRFLIVDVCLDSGGSINEAGVCIDENYHEQYIVISIALLAMYFALGLIVSLASVFVLGKLSSASNGSNTKT